MSPKDADRMSNNVDPDQSSLISGSIPFADMSVQKFRIIIVAFKQRSNRPARCAQFRGLVGSEETTNKQHTVNKFTDFVKTYLQMHWEQWKRG